MKTKFLFLVLLAQMFTLTASAQDVEIEGICYSLSDDGSAAVIYKKYSGDIVIPSSVTYQGKDYPVVSIDNSAFKGNSGLTSVTIPNSVTSIGKHVFEGCSGLTSIKVESGNTFYDSRDNCNAIIETSTNTLILGCKETNIPNSVTSIGDNAFSDCRGLTSLTIPNSVTSVGKSAFQNCSGLTSVTIPSSVTYIDDQAFHPCHGLTSIKVESGNTIYDSRNNCNAIIETSTNTLIVGCKGTSIPNSVTSIGDYAFWECWNLTSVAIPNSVTSIGKSAFSSCGLTSVTIPNSVTSIGDYAFRYCNFTSVTIPNSITSIGSSTFEDCSDLTSVTIPNSVTSIGSSAFEGCSSLTSVTIPISVTSIGPKAFKDCSGLTSVTIPNSVTSIDYYAFSGCSGLTSVTIPNSVTSIGSSAFEGCSGLTSVTIPNSVTSSLHNTFKNCSGLTSVSIPNSVTSIEFTFNNCSSLTAVTIPNSVTSISGAFYNCSALTSVTIPNSVTSIGSSAFYNCSSLTSVTIPNSVTSIKMDAFNGCSGLTSVTIPNSVTSIGESAFCNCNSLTSVTIPNSITSIEDYLFQNCSGLTSVTIPSSVTTIGEKVLVGCQHVEEVYCYAESVPRAYGLFEGAWEYTNATLHVPATSIDAYKATAPWSWFSKIEALPQIIYKIEGDIYKTVTYPIGEAIIPEEEPIKAGYTFSGWIGIPETMPTEDVTVTGTFTLSNVEYVDLGLPSGLRWATCNIGADSPEQFGVYYDWDKNPVQESWDNMWRTPTKAERDELVKYCIYSVETINGIRGGQYTGINGQTIFFPFAGYCQNGNGPYEIGVRGQYWTVTEYDGRRHWVLGTNNSTQADDEDYYWPLEYFGFPVRPVTSGTPTDPVFVSSYPMNKETTKHVYSIDGRPLNKLQKGMNIIRTSDGQTKKVMVK